MLKVNRTLFNITENENNELNKLKEYLSLNDDEIEAIVNYVEKNSNFVNFLLLDDGGEYEDTTKINERFLNKSGFDGFTQDVENAIDEIVMLYRAFLKENIPDIIARSSYRGTDEKEIRFWENHKIINKPTCSSEKNGTWKNHALNSLKPAFLDIYNEGAMIIDLKALCKKYNDEAKLATNISERGFVIAPFIKVIDISEERCEELETINGKMLVKTYKLDAIQDELLEITLDEENKLKQEILEKTEEIFNDVGKLIENLRREWVINRDIKALNKAIDDYKTKIENEKEEFKDTKAQNLESSIQTLEQLLSDNQIRLQEIQVEGKKIKEEDEILKQEISEWKSKISRLCRSRSYHEEKDIQTQLEQMEEDALRTQKDIESRKILYDRKSLEKNISKNILYIVDQLDVTLENIEEYRIGSNKSVRCIRELIELLDDEAGHSLKAFYSSAVEDYVRQIKSIIESIQRLKNVSSQKDGEVIRINILIEQIKNKLPNEDKIWREVEDVFELENNFLNRTIFSEFCKLAKANEMTMINNLRNEYVEKEKDKFLFMKSNKAKEAEIECQKIDEFLDEVEHVESTEKFEQKYFEKDVYSYITYFIEEHGFDPSYSETIRKLKTYKQILDEKYQINYGQIKDQIEHFRNRQLRGGKSYSEFMILECTSKMPTNKQTNIFIQKRNDIPRGENAIILRNIHREIEQTGNEYFGWNQRMV